MSCLLTWWKHVGRHANNSASPVIVCPTAIYHCAAIHECVKRKWAEVSAESESNSETETVKGREDQFIRWQGKTKLTRQNCIEKCLNIYLVVCLLSKVSTTWVNANIVLMLQLLNDWNVEWYHSIMFAFSLFDPVN